MIKINRLYPKANSGRFYILSLLRIVNEEISGDLKDVTKIIDFGCGNMPYRSIFEQSGIEYIGVDLESNDSAEMHLTNGKIPLPDSSVDVVISTQVLEHVTNPELYLSECRRVLKIGGKLILSTHGHWMYHPDPKDLWRWTKDGLILTIEKNGFKVRKCYGLMGLAASGLQLFQDGFRQKVPSFLLGTFFRLIAWVQVKLDKWNTFSEDASVFLTLSEKK